MCWITFHPHHHSHHGRHHGHHHHHHPHLASPVEEVVRVRWDSPKSDQRIRILSPTSSSCSEPSSSSRHSHHHHHYQPHPIIRLHGHGIRRARAPSPPPPSMCSIREDNEVHIQVGQRTTEPRYRTVIATPASTARVAVQSSTRNALREVRERCTPRRSRVRRVAGYEVLRAQVPWSWDCISSEGGERGEGKSRKKDYPPFGPASSWM